MPHDGLDDIPRPAVVDSVLRPGVGPGESPAPKRGRTAPTTVDSVLHEESVLDHVRVRVDLLVAVSRKLPALGNRRSPIIVFLSLP